MLPIVIMNPRQPRNPSGAIPMKQFLTAVLLLIVVQPVVAADQPPITLSDVPKWDTRDYKADAFIAAAAKFQALGKEKACECLLELAGPQAARTIDEGTRREGLFILCRMIFTARAKEEFRRPSLGAAVCVGSIESKLWSREPIEIVDGVPFLVVRGYIIGGLPESVDDYVKYCINNCAWNSFEFKPKSAEEKQKSHARG